MVMQKGAGKSILSDVNENNKRKSIIPNGDDALMFCFLKE